MSTLRIVRAGPQHAAGIHAVADAVRYDPARANPARGFLVLPATPAWWADAIARAEASFVALERDRVVGFVYAYLEDLGETLKIDRIAVDEAHARRGIAQQLIDAAHGATNARRSRAMILHAPVRNRASISFFRSRNGYRLADRIRGAEAGAGLDDAAFVWGCYERP